LVNGGQTIQNNSCVPTSTANGLAYLEAYQVNVLGQSDPFTVSPDNYTAVNSLQGAQGVTASGTSAADALSGLNNYLASSNPAPNVVTSQTADPSAQSLANALNANSAIQLGILWGVVANDGTFIPTDMGGGHFVSLTGESLTAGSGTMTLLDPWGINGVSPNAGTQGASITVNVSTVNLTGVGNVLELIYPNTLTDPPDDLNTENGTGVDSFGIASRTVGYIAVDDIESVVPEPTSMVLMGVGALALLAKRRRSA